MARITVEDCIGKFPSRFELVLVASNRARKLHSGETPTVAIDNDKNTVIALREIAEETVTSEQLKNDLIEEYQTNTFTEDEDINEIEDNSDQSETEENSVESGSEDISDESETEETELDINETNQGKEDINQPVEENPIESSQDNLEIHSDNDKI